LNCHGLIAASYTQAQEMIMGVPSEDDDEQTARWNGSAGHGWVELQVVLDEMFRPFEQLLVDMVAARRGGHVLDIGCGTGSTTVAAARRLGAQGRCVGVDLSDPMIAAARARAEREDSQARFVRRGVARGAGVAALQGRRPGGALHLPRLAPAVLPRGPRSHRARRRPTGPHHTDTCGWAPAEPSTRDRGR
jgi:SAM-dependent methyltransferase